MNELIRTSKIHPGHSCGRFVPLYNPCDKAPTCTHGWHGDEWLYAVANDQAGLRLTVFTNEHQGVIVMPYSKPGTGLVTGPYGADLTMHLVFPSAATDEGILSALRAEPDRCDVLASGRCYPGYSSGLSAKLFDEHGDKTAFVQPESFWRVLEAKFDSLLTSALVTRVDTRFRICERCGGEGYVGR